jgi:plasmid segregation protein ParM
MTNQPILAGFDPGHNANKVAWIQANQLKQFVLPSTVGLATRKKKDGLTLGGVIYPDRQQGRDPYHVRFNGVEYLVGPNVDQLTKPIDRLDLDRFTDSPELRATFYASAAHILNGREQTMALAMALPVSVLQDKEEAERVERGIRSWLVGEHCFSVDGVEKHLQVSHVRTKIPQPVATWFDWGLDCTGQWVKGKEAQKAPTLIIDEGFNTLDVVVIEGGRISDRLSGGETLGMSRAAEELIDLIKTQTGVELELPRANELIKTVVNGHKAEIYVSGHLVEVTQMARSAIQSLGADVDNYFSRHLGKSRARVTYRVLLTGGGVLALSSRLLRRFPDATVIVEPVLANARGLAKLAVRPGFLM